MDGWARTTWKRMAISVKGGGGSAPAAKPRLCLLWSSLPLSFSFPSFTNSVWPITARSGVLQTGRRQTGPRCRGRAGRVVIKVTAAISLLQLTNCCRLLARAATREGGAHKAHQKCMEILIVRSTDHSIGFICRACRRRHRRYRPNSKLLL